MQSDAQSQTRPQPRVISSSARPNGNVLFRFLYNHNPFYLISGGLILFGLSCYAQSQTNSFSNGELSEETAITMAGMLAGYVVLMAITVILVVRVAKVWEDARTIFLVLVLSMLRLSVFFDQLCSSNWWLAATLLLAGFLFSIAVSELTLALTQLRLRTCFRLPIYLIFAFFFATPILLSVDVNATEFNELFRLMLFPTGMGILFLTFMPAIRKGRAACAHNGSPWHWPLYPWSLVVTLVVAVLFRASTLAISFGPTAETGLILNPIFLLPFFFCLALLLVETSLVENLPGLRKLVFIMLWGTLFIAPSAIDTPWQTDAIQTLQRSFGNLTALIGWSLACLFLCFNFRGIRSARLMASLCIAFVSFQTTEFPLIGSSLFSIGAIASIPMLIEFANAIVDRKKSLNWISVGAFAAFWSFAISDHLWGTTEAAYIATIVFGVACMIIGMIFEDDLSRFFRAVAAISSGSVATVTTYLTFFGNLNETLGIIFVGTLLGTTICYWSLIGRSGWLQLAAWNSILFFICVGHSLKESIVATFDGQLAFAMTSGAGCFLIAVFITAVKAGIVKKVWNSIFHGRRQSVLPGF